MSETGSRNGVLVGAQASGASRSAQAVPPAHEGPDPELRARPTSRRRFTSAYKLRILEEAEGCGPGEVGALLRREGLYSSHLTMWRRLRATGALQAGKRSAVPAAKLKEALRQVSSLERENRRLRLQVERAETIVAVQKKLCSLLQLSPVEAGSS